MESAEILGPGCFTTPLLMFYLYSTLLLCQKCHFEPNFAALPSAPPMTYESLEEFQNSGFSFYQQKTLHDVSSTKWQADNL